MLEQENEERQGIIVFLTDGNMNVNPWGERTNEIAQQDVLEAKRVARERNIPIHTIGLNFDGNLAWHYVEPIARETYGLAFETSNAEDIPVIVEAFFHAMISAPQYREYSPPQIQAEEEIEIHEETEIHEVLEVLEETPTETPANAAQIAEEAPRHVYILIAAGILFLIFATILFAKATKVRRVFTGKIILQVDGEGLPRSLNLIEYGNRISLGAILGNAAFNPVILSPSPNAPSHLPQLQIKCKNRDILFEKDFIEQEGKLSISGGTEITVTAQDTRVHLKYATETSLL
jgi:hypothetical protein